MNIITDRFVLFVLDHPNEDIHHLFNRFVYSLTEEEYAQIAEVVPVVLGIGESARDASDEIKKVIVEDIQTRCRV